MNLPLSPELVERILARLGLRNHPEPTLDGLRILYAAWCANVPFDNVRKIIHVRSGNPGPFPGSTAVDFLETWLNHGTGGTCWSGAGALHALLSALGFNAIRGVATMLAAPNIPPNHGTVLVIFGDHRYIVDSSMLHVEPLLLDEHHETSINHPAWGLRCAKRDGRWHAAWRPLHKTDGFECRFEHFDAAPEEFRDRYEQTRAWSPFNYQVCARRNSGNEVTGLAFGNFVSLKSDGSVVVSPVAHHDRVRILVEEVGMSEEIANALPEDVPTPPPPGSKTAMAVTQ